MRIHLNRPAATRQGHGISDSPTMKHIRLDETLTCRVHAALHDDSTALARIMDESRRASAAGPVSWRVTLTPRNVHCIEGLVLLAQICRCSVDFEAGPDLSERQRDFCNDVLEHYACRPDGPRPARGPDGVRFYLALGREFLPALVFMPPAALRPRPKLPGRRCRHATLIGAYGCEHSGDIATLGGVLLRLHKQFGLQEACLLSDRPDYTRHLLASLDTPVAVEVRPGEPGVARRSLQETGMLVWAGGNVMERPLLLARHLSTIHAARLRGLPFLLEGVGTGPFMGPVGRWLAARIFHAADRVVARTTGIARDPLLEGVEVTPGQDPAFEYLATRTGPPVISGHDRQGIDALLENTAGHILVGVNLRPIQHIRVDHSESYSRVTEDRIYQHLAVAMTDYARLAPAPVTYVFFPMNLLQDGYSDLAAAWRLNRMLHKGLDLRIWQADPDIDTRLYLLRRLHMVLAMRFHASIFAMSQGVPAIGIDYDPCEFGKVMQLFRDRERVEDVRRLGIADIHFMVERLLMNQPGGNNHPEKYP